jgi:hypothetical protein
MILTKLFLYYIIKLSCKFQLLGPNGSLEEDFENIPPIYAHVKTVSPIVAPPDSREL